MGRIGVVEKFEANTDEGEMVDVVTVDIGGGALISIPHAGVPGDDSPPLNGDYVVMVSHPGGVGEIAVAYADPTNPRGAAQGERKINARNAAGVIIASIWMKGDGSITAVGPAGEFSIAADGSITLENSAGSISLAAGGAVDINGNLTVAV